MGMSISYIVRTRGISFMIDLQLKVKGNKEKIFGGAVPEQIEDGSLL